MIPRYTLPEMGAIWSEENKFSIWERIEVLAAEAWAREGIVPEGAAQVIRERAAFTIERIAEHEAVTDHDVVAFVRTLAEAVGEGGEWVHYGLTSSDVVDTASAVRLRDALDLVVHRVDRAFAACRAAAHRYRDVLMAGRTHGQHAEPTTFGLKMSLLAFELHRQRDRLRAARRAIAFGSLSGPVGTYSQVPPQVEAYVCKQLGLAVEPQATQVIQRDRHAEVMWALAATAATLEKAATEIRHLARTEVGEVTEPFRAGQTGSSAMPHKRNPIVSERISGLARLVRAQLAPALENVVLWHERDISHSSVERVIWPDAFAAIDYCLERFTWLVENVEVHPDAMAANLVRTGGVVFSSTVLNALIAAGMPRDEAYAIVQEHGIAVAAEGGELLERLSADKRVVDVLGKDDLAACFKVAPLLARTQVIFDRLDALPG